MASKFYQYRAARILRGTQWLHDAVITIGIDGYITSIEPFCTDKHPHPVDLGAISLLPGMIDTHVHGACGCDVMDATHHSLNTMSEFFASQGVTGFIATTVTAPVTKIRDALKQVATSKKLGVDGADLLGAYLEGPYFTERHKGAHPTEWFRELSIEELDDWISYSDGTLLCLALAPEKSNSLDAIRYLKKQGIQVMLGHSDASFDVVQQALECGANGIVHCYNGMRGIHHRDPGVVGAGLCHNNSYVEIIADGNHVHPAAIDIAYRCCGERLTLITDAMRATSMPDGKYSLGEMTVSVKNGIALTESNGLAGSTLTMPIAIKNMMKWLNLPLEEAWLLASRTPALSMGLNNLGTLEAGKLASMVALNSDYSISKTWVNGRLVFDSATPEPELLCI